MILRITKDVVVQRSIHEEHLTTIDEIILPEGTIIEVEIVG